MDQPKSSRVDHTLGEGKWFCRIGSVLLPKFKKILSVACYNAQPQWFLSEVPADSIPSALQVVNEFLTMAGDASLDFCWLLTPVTKEMDWKKHGWKHISSTDIEEFVQAHREEFPPEVRID